MTEKPVRQVIFKFKKKNVDMGIKKSALQSLILHSNQFVKNIQTCDIGALKWKKLGKSQNHKKSSNLANIHYFVK